MGNNDFRCIANLPYSITSQFLIRLLKLPSPPREMLFLLQKETGQRLAASHGNRDYGSLSILVQSVYQVEYLRTVPPQVFYPRPEIDSALVRFHRLAEFPPPKKLSALEKTIRAAFSQRRKQMRNPLAKFFDQTQITEAFSTLELSPHSRAEELTVAQFQHLAEVLNSN